MTRVEIFQKALFALYAKHKFVIIADSQYHGLEIYDLTESSVALAHRLQDESTPDDTERDERSQYNCRKCRDSGIMSDDGLRLVCAIQGTPIPKLKYFPCVKCNIEGYKKVTDCYSDFYANIAKLEEEVNKLREENDKERIVEEVLEMVRNKMDSLTDLLEDYDG